MAAENTVSYNKYKGLRPVVAEEIIRLAKSCGLKKVVLFGSRARGDYKEKSDIDLAVLGENVSSFRIRIEEEIKTLLQFDIVDLDKATDQELLSAIEREGVVLYEEIR
ncbi:MAG: nucleotidyltransferase domain-containing protein [Firmicutes bacterium]|nr:nucleotidyltransferase domain-containing protein [Bacillota bacterium]